jgi:hypothetical protein
VQVKARSKQGYAMPCLASYDGHRRTKHSGVLLSKQPEPLQVKVNRRAAADAEKRPTAKRKGAGACKGGDAMKRCDIHKYALEWQEKTGLHYLPRGEMPPKIPTGCILVHNKAVHTVRSRPGISGFRAWFQEQSVGKLIPSNKLISCNCDWAGLPHYRLR